MKIQDLLDMRKVLELVSDGYLRERAHPEHPALRTLGYTEKAQWDRLWCHETLTCRGLIYEAESGEVLARPWPKFFNYGEPGAAALALSDRVEVTDKMDGSLGILFRNPYTGELTIATRGSFDSDQARLANDQFVPALFGGAGLDDAWEPIDGITYLTEIIHPSNRIVLDYGKKQGLALLGGVRIETGEVFGPWFDERWPDHRTESFGVMTVGDALAMPPRPNAEGLVLRFDDGGSHMVKVKQEDYVRLHKLVTGLSDKAVWEQMSENHGDVTAMAEAIPDEFHTWLLVTTAEFAGSFAGIMDKALDDYEAIRFELKAPPGALIDRKSFAELAKKNERPHLMFQLLDGRDIEPSIWKELRPVGVRYMNQAAREEALS